MEFLFDIFIITACTAERCFRVDRAQENLHYVTDIANDVIYVLDQECPTLPQTPENEMAPSLLMQPNISSLESSDKDSREGTPQSPSQKFFNRSLSGPNSVPTSESLSPGLDGGTSRKSSQGSQGSSGSAKNSLHSSKENILTGDAGNGDMNNKTWVHNEWKKTAHHRTHTHTYFPHSMSLFKCKYANKKCHSDRVTQHNRFQLAQPQRSSPHLTLDIILCHGHWTNNDAHSLTSFHLFRRLIFFTRTRMKYPWLLLPPQHRDKADIWKKLFHIYMRKLDSLLSCLLTLMSAAFTTVCSVLMKMHSDSGIT